MTTRTMLPTMHKALSEAGTILERYFGTVKKISFKLNHADLLTEADSASEQKIITLIKAVYPDHNIIAEESGLIDQGSRYTWVIDPLDGTANFASGVPLFGVLICLLEDYRPIIAGAYLPILRRTYFAEKGGGAFCNNTRIRVSSATRLADVLACQSIHYSQDNEDIAQQLVTYGELVKKSRGVRNFSCAAIETCFVADGSLGVYIGRTNKIWDVAAGTLLIQEAGGFVSDLELVKRIDFSYTKETYNRLFPFVGTTSLLRSEVRQIIQDSGRLLEG